MPCARVCCARVCRRSKAVLPRDPDPGTVGVDSPAFRGAFTLIELLISVAIIIILVAIAVPAIGLVRNKVNASTALTTVTTIQLALQQYAGEDSRHRYPAQIAAGDLRLAKAAPGGAACVLDLLLDYGWSMNGSESLDRSGAPWPLLDPWKKPYFYKVDDDLLGLTGPQRPLDLDGWNAEGVRPWAYVWSAGPNATSDGAGWIYVRDSR